MIVVIFGAQSYLLSYDRVLFNNYLRVTCILRGSIREIGEDSWFGKVIWGGQGLRVIIVSVSAQRMKRSLSWSDQVRRSMVR